MGEPLMVEHSVDLALWGHHHSYQRTCAIVGGKCEQKGPIHLVAGMAGYELAPDTNLPQPPAPYWQVVTNKHWGFMRLEFQNSSSLHVSFIGDHDAAVLDSFWVHR